MKHAGADALTTLAGLIATIREHGFKEPRPGVFYRRGKAFLHFHEDAAGLFADLRVNDEWERFRVTDADEQAAFLRVLRASA
ncbi:hypothetical protein [Paraburkholderia sp. DHOC27]|uniref:hypothetical protein n=1 Tax=Paraburkholderia sp. DHOC27 TaxID=2303330 RepID=UPI000E3B7866|nr:hypothetical protein [Paraburkholderia sp. DHOC27]RFU47004.1 hypothetical protein D0B32_12600 [Paraburkholderia sp. DHOC27]